MEDPKPNLTNDDFRQLLMTPRAGGSSANLSSKSANPSSGFSHKSHGGFLAPSNDASTSIADAKSAKDQKKKTKAAMLARSENLEFDQKKRTEEKPRIRFYKQGKDDDDSLTSILKKYRDRAKERRVDVKDGTATTVDVSQATAGYRAVAPDKITNLDAAERRKQAIEESKYLGGDMEHTHLVKGLDYALLQKVRSEITAKHKDDQDLETAYQNKKRDDNELEAQLKSKLAKNVYRILFRHDLPKVSELFAPRRMAYVIELDDDFAESDIPTTLLRSKQECPTVESTATLTPNDVVIQKLTQVLSYLRTDTKKKRKEKGNIVSKEMDREAKMQTIYDNVGDYIPPQSRTIAASAETHSSSEKQAKGSYFDKSVKTEPDRSSSRKEQTTSSKSSKTAVEKTKTTETKPIDSRLAAGFSPADLLLQQQQQTMFGSAAKPLGREANANDLGRTDDALSKKRDATGRKSSAKNPADSYTECYPEAFEGFETIIDSDDEEADFSKMDLGNKKGPVRRWDFDTDEQYEEYMSKREAMPKAAFQYGVKMNDGRKTRKTQGGKNEKDERAKLDREWQQIQNLISKRKGKSSNEAENAKKQKLT